MSPKFCILCIGLFLTCNFSTEAQFRYNYLDMGRFELRDKNYSEAILYFNSYINDVPARYDGYYFRGIAKYYLDDLAGADNDFSRAIEILPEYPEVYLLRAIVRSERNYLLSALVDFRKAIALDSMFTDAWFYQTVAFYNLKKYEDALNSCNKVIALNKNYKDIYLMHGQINARLENYQIAITDFCYYIEGNKNNPGAYTERGLSYIEIEKTDLALQDFNKAVSLDSNNTYALFQRGLAYLKLQDYPNALKDLDKVVQLSPENQLAYFNRAIANSSNNANENALLDYQNIIERNPENMLVYYNLGLTYMQLKKYRQAILSFDKAIELYPDYTDAYSARSQAKNASGDIAGAIDDKKMSEIILQKNLAKNEALKNNENKQLLKLTHFNAEFITDVDTVGKLQYQKKDIQLLPFYRLGTGFDKANNYAYDSGNKKWLGKQPVTLASFENENLNEIKIQLSQLTDSINKHTLPSLLLLIERATLYSLTSEFDKAFTDLDVSHSIDPQNILVYFVRGNVRLAKLKNYYEITRNENNIATEDLIWVRNEFTRLLLDYNTVISLEPNFAFANFNRGYARFLNNDFQGAWSDFSNANVGNKLPEASFNKGLMGILLDKTDEACLDLSQAGSMGIKEAYAIIKKYCNDDSGN